MDSSYDEQIYKAMKFVNDSMQQKLAEEEPVEIDFTPGFVMIEDQKTDFAKRKILNEKIELYMPERFEQMKESVAKLKYPYENRPKYIYSNDEYSINLTFTPKEQSASQEELAEICSQFYSLMPRVSPSTQQIEKSEIIGDGIDIPCFEIMTTAMDSKIYNLFFFLTIDGKLVIGSFNCLESSMDDWMPVIKAMLKTIELDGESI
jgi:hypothetical protein